MLPEEDGGDGRAVGWRPDCVSVIGIKEQHGPRGLNPGPGSAVVRLAPSASCPQLSLELDSPCMQNLSTHICTNFLAWRVNHHF